MVMKLAMGGCIALARSKDETDVGSIAVCYEKVVSLN
jgi:hypothetical protein